MELSRAEPTRYHKVSHDPAAIESLFVDLFLDAHKKAPKEIILDLDATDDPLHGNQEGKFFHGYYDCYCYLPLYIFCGRHLLAAKLRRSNMDAAAGAVEEVARIVAQIRRRWPRTRILLRGDSGFTREPLMAWCEANRVDYVFGLARNDRLEQAIIPELITATIESIRTGKTARCFKDFSYATLSTWSRERRVIGKAEVTGGEANPRFVVTSLKHSEAGARHLYEKVYCARGDMENRIKECQLDLFADRTSTATMQANQLRLWFASMAYVLLCALRRIGLAHTQFAEATCGTIRLKLLKLGALVRVSVRRIKIAMASACPWRDAVRTRSRAAAPRHRLIRTGQRTGPTPPLPTPPKSRRRQSIAGTRLLHGSRQDLRRYSVRVRNAYSRSYSSVAPSPFPLPQGEGEGRGGRHSSFASSVISAFSTFDTGQFAFAPAASSWNFASSRPGTFARSTRCTAAIFQPAPSCSMVSVASQCRLSGG